MKTNKKSNSFSNFTTLGRIRLLGFLTALALILSLSAVFLMNSNLIRDWENRFQSQFYLWRVHFSEPVATELPLVLVLIDDHSLPVESARSPIDRAWLASLLETIHKQKPILVAMNILLDRPGIKIADEQLKNTIAQAGNIILRTDPFYPVFPDFDKVALDKGVLKFRLDSSDTIQEVCSNLKTCLSTNIFYRKILDYYYAHIGIPTRHHQYANDWLKINFSPSSQEDNSVNVRTFPILRAHEIEQLPADALKGKIVLIGTGFPDLYPLYKIPLAQPELMLQETEIIAQILNMIASNSYLESFSKYWTGILLLGFMVLVAFVIVYQGSIMGLMTTIGIIIGLYITAGWAFAFHNLELAFVFPSSMLMFFAISGILTSSVQERFSRLNTEISLKQAKIDFLTNELHSHHLFNEFSRLGVMIQHDPKSAKDYLVEFAEMLRSSLKYGDQPMVPVGIQIEYLESYLKQQQVIFQERLIFKFNKAEEIESFQVPWHTFFPLVENAVKYTEGFIKLHSLDSATIKIDLSLAKNSLVFSVSNPYDVNVEAVSTKTGLKNLKERLILSYPNGGFLLNLNHDDHNWKAELSLPI